MSSGYIICSLIFFILVFVVFANYSIEEKDKIHSDAMQSLIVDAQTSSEELEEDLQRYIDFSRPGAEILAESSNIKSDNQKNNEELREDLQRYIDYSKSEILAESSSIKSEQMISIIKKIAETIKVDKIAIASADGQAVTNLRETYNVSDKSYFREAMLGTEVIFNAEYYDMDHGENLVLAEPISKGQVVLGALLFYYPISQFDSLIDNNAFDGKAIHLLIDKNGVIAGATNNADTNYKVGQNIFTIIGESDFSKGSVDKMKDAVARTECGVSCYQNSKEHKYISYAPVGIGNWYTMSVVNYKFIKTSETRESNFTEDILTKLVVCLILYVFSIITMGIIGRQRYASENKKLQTKAETDALTQLLNKATTENEIRDYISGPGMNSKSILIILDIDNFKKINDTKGHAFGDEVLRNLGLKLKGVFRVSDILGRTGGDEFVIFLKDLKDNETIKREAGRVEEFFHDFKTGEYVKYSVTASIGVSIYPYDATSFEGLYQLADKALYKAKRRGKNQIAFYNENF